MPKLNHYHPALPETPDTVRQLRHVVHGQIVDALDALDDGNPERVKWLLRRALSALNLAERASRAEATERA